MSADTPEHVRIAIVGGGPAGLMAAEVATAAGVQVDHYWRPILNEIPNLRFGNPIIFD